MGAESSLTVRGWEYGGLLFEKYVYSPGRVGPLPKHSHHEYQFGLGLNTSGEYYYRGASHPVPAGSITTLHTGEAHVPVGKGHFPTTAEFRQVYVDPARLRTAAEVANGPADAPFFRAPVVISEDLNRLYLALHVASESGAASRLELDSLALLLLSRLAARHAHNRPPARRFESSREAVARARVYIEDNFARNISLDELVGVAGLSGFHLCRLFRKELGAPPHAYQTQVRVARAKRLLLSGASLSAVSAETGFYDQSHFGLHFKRLVGVTPGSYRGESKNFLDA